MRTSELLASADQLCVDPLSNTRAASYVCMRSMDQTYKYENSLRSASLNDTLRRAQVMAKRLGISRVTNTTQLDRVGVPVYTSIRPNALDGSLCVNAGKGATELEACVGAYMEAIEYAMAEPNRGGLRLSSVAARQILDGPAKPDSILDFCPVLGMSIPLDKQILCTPAVDIRTGDEFLVPEELVFLPSSQAPSECYFGSASTGLTSGNTVDEASVHGILEVIEHDIYSFQFVKDRSSRVDIGSLPADTQRLVGQISAAGLDICVDYHPNPFGIAYFRAIISDMIVDLPHFRNGGFGCHVHSHIAINRALTEAVQSRMSFVHGGRDDLGKYAHIVEKGHQHRLRRKLAPAIADERPVIEFAQVPDHEAQLSSVGECLKKLLDLLEALGFDRVLRVRFTTDDDSVQVVKIIIPRLEDFDFDSVRVGRRLMDYAGQR